jgi:hypothetical protein
MSGPHYLFKEKMSSMPKNASEIVLTNDIIYVPFVISIIGLIGNFMTFVTILRTDNMRKVSFLPNTLWEKFFVAKLLFFWQKHYANYAIFFLFFSVFAKKIKVVGLTATNPFNDYLLPRIMPTFMFSCCSAPIPFFLPTSSSDFGLKLTR